MVFNKPINFTILPYACACMTRPSIESFDVAKEVKLVLRNQPNKPESWLARVGSRAVAQLKAELGYVTAMTNFLGFATLAEVYVYAARKHIIWLGVFGKWYLLLDVDDF